MADYFRQNGFCILEGLFDEPGIARLQNAMDTYRVSQGSPIMTSMLGFGINPLAVLVPETVGVLKELLQDEVRLVHAGARMSSNESEAAIGWRRLEPCHL